MSGLTTHILDLSAGKPAAAVAYRLLERGSGAPEPRAEGHTDADGRAKLLSAEAMKATGYRLEFDIGPYFRAVSPSLANSGFLETVVIDFNVIDPAAHHHVPLLVSPFGYSTYRGS